MLAKILQNILPFFTSLRLTFVCLCYGVVLVFIGTLAQVHEGLYQAQTRYFKSFFVWWGPPGAGWEIPILPAGYLLGFLLVLNLTASYIARYEFSRRRAGLLLVHSGLILLLLGQLLTDMLSRESAMRLTEGEWKNYSESFRETELVLIDTSEADADKMVSIPEHTLVAGRGIAVPQTPVTLRVKQLWPNAELTETKGPNAIAPGATEGIARAAFVIPRAVTAKSDERNNPSAVVEVEAGGKALGSYLLSPNIRQPDTFVQDGKTYQLALRVKRFYQPFKLQLLKFHHEKYAGTDIPKNFMSEIRLEDPASGESRETKIYMNNPLRYRGQTFYQGSYDPNDPRVSILQVVRNPSWLAPYLSCLLVGAGLTIQFMSHLGGFVKSRKAVAA